MDTRIEKIYSAADYIKERIGHRKPVAGIVLGSGLGKLADKIANKNNNITNCKFYCADAQDFMKRYDGEKMDTVFVDPPRKGCDEDTLNAIISMNVPKISMIRCKKAVIS